MNSTITTYTATYTIHDIISRDVLTEECRVLVGVDPQNIEWHDSPNITNFTVTDIVPSEIDSNMHFKQIQRDFERFMGVPVTLGAIIVDD